MALKCHLPARTGAIILKYSKHLQRFRYRWSLIAIHINSFASILALIANTQYRLHLTVYWNICSFFCYCCLSSMHQSILLVVSFQIDVMTWTSFWPEKMQPLVDWATDRGQVQEKAHINTAMQPLKRINQI